MADMKGKCRLMSQSDALKQTNPNRTVRSTGKGYSQTSGKRRKRKKSKAPIIALAAVITLVAAIVCVYLWGYFYYKDRFTANTYVNDVNVSEMTFDEAAEIFKHTDIPDTIDITRPSGDVVKISTDAIDYKYSAEEELKRIYDGLDKKSWFAYKLKDSDFSFTDVASYNAKKLTEQLELSDWGSNENQNAKIVAGDDGYEVVAEVQGDVFDKATLENYITEMIDKGEFTITATDSGAYTAPEVTSSYYDKKLETLNKIWNTELNFNFDYTKEKLTGKRLCNLVKVKVDGTYTVKEDECMKYVEKLAKKYDTYNTERNFHATLQGDIVVPTSDDAKYGWWIDQQETCDLLVSLIEDGESQESIDPIYYATGGYEFTGLASARSADDDIGDTYIEIDLTAQHFWYYKDGELVREADIVSGQTTSEARTTLPGVYKVWYKDTDYEMKGSNEDGDTWDVTCNYWTRVAIVGIGLHDSTWRGTAFGGNIYTYNGSHGCINMTYDDAKFVYEEVDMGTPVVMYY
jgi:lipoprotein-anchoring transpeptidase ErfK/SrfK